MRPHDPLSDDGPELVPPAELLRLRQILRREPSAAVREQHVAATAMAARHRSGVGQMGRFASRGARVAVAVVACLAITSGLAGAQLLPQPAQRLLSNVSDRFAPEDESPPDDAPPATAVEAGDDDSSTTDDRPSQSPGAADASTFATDTGSDTDAGATTPTTSRPPAATTTTIPGPTGPGSPEDPTDPNATTTTTTTPGSTTTTTAPGSTTTTTAPGSTTTTTGAPAP